MRINSRRFTFIYKRKNWLLATLLVTLMVLGGGYVVSKTYAVDDASYQQIFPNSLPTQNTVAKIEKYSIPVRLQIPKLKIDAAVNMTGITKAGDMAVPSNIKDVGWYKHGPHPGEVGSAVIAGHTIGRKGEPGVFRDLGKLQAGDVFRTVDDKGQAANFIIRETRTYSKDDQPTGVFDVNDKSYLNLITCTGAWDASQHSYADRLVVFAEKTE